MQKCLIGKKFQLKLSHPLFKNAFYTHDFNQDYMSEFTVTKPFFALPIWHKQMENKIHTTQNEPGILGYCSVSLNCFFCDKSEFTFLVPRNNATHFIFTFIAYPSTSILCAPISQISIIHFKQCTSDNDEETQLKSHMINELISTSNLCNQTFFSKVLPGFWRMNQCPGSEGWS